MRSVPEASASVSSGHLFLGGRHGRRGCPVHQDGRILRRAEDRESGTEVFGEHDSYYDFTHLFSALALTLGEGYAIHKQDIFVRKRFVNEDTGKQEFLSESYFRYFKGRAYTDSMCYLTITQEARKSRLFSFDNKKWRDFLVKIRKVQGPVAGQRSAGAFPEQIRGKRLRGPVFLHELQGPYHLDDELQVGRRERLDG